MLLSALMVFALFTPLAAYAGEENEKEPVSDYSQIFSTDDVYSTTKTVTFGGYEWYIVGYDGVGIASAQGDGTVTLLAKSYDQNWVTDYRDVLGNYESATDDWPAAFKAPIEPAPEGYKLINGGEGGKNYKYFKEPWENSPTEYKGSDLAAKMDEIYAGFSRADAMLIQDRTLSEAVKGDHADLNPFGPEVTAPVWALTYGDYATLWSAAKSQEADLDVIIYPFPYLLSCGTGLDSVYIGTRSKDKLEETFVQDGYFTPDYAQATLDYEHYCYPDSAEDYPPTSYGVARPALTLDLSKVAFMSSTENDGVTSLQLSPGATITFNAQNGTEATSVNMESGTAIGELPAASRTGYTFNGWFTQTEGGEQITADSVFYTDQDLYAQWTVKSYTLTYDLNGGSVLGGNSNDDETKEITYDEAYGELITPQYAGHIFLGWFTELNGGEEVTAETTHAVDDHVTIFAHWRQWNVNDADLSAELNAKETQISLSASNIDLDNVVRVRAAVWGAAKANGDAQNDLKWYTLKETDGTYAGTAAVSNHKEVGTYYIHFYADFANGSSLFVGSKSVTVSAATSEVTVEDVSPADGTFTVQISDVKSASGQSRIQVAVWTAAGGQDDLRWYDAVSTDGGQTFSYTVDIADHGNEYGQYYAHVYLYAGNGTVQFIGSATPKFVPEVSLTAELSADQKTMTITATGVQLAPGVKNVQFAVWGQAKVNGNAQNDLVWYPAKSKGNGTYEVSLPVSNHKEVGVYAIHAYAWLTDGQAMFLNGTSATVDAPSATVEVGDVNEDGSFFVTVSGIQSASGVSKVQVPTWTVAGGQDDLVWHDAAKVDDETYVAKISALSHKSEFGAYTSHVYVTDGNGTVSFVGGDTVTQEAPAVQVTSTCTSGKRIDMSATGVVLTPGVTAVKFAVWGQKAVNGNTQNDLIWYDGVYQGDGRWICTAQVSNHKEVGAYYVHAYATLANGKTVFLNGSSFTVKPASAEVTAVDLDDENGTFTIRVAKIQSQSGVFNPRVAVWSVNGGQDDLVWYPAVSMGDGVYEVAVDTADHKGDTGLYYAHAYITGGNGIDFFVGGASPTIG
jgi:uncharacterized repeat protein (TIGR02543 family)